MPCESTPEYRFISVEQGDGCAVIALNRPKVNALSLDLVREIRAAVVGLEADDAVGCIVITGAGQRAFSGGADVPTIQESLRDAFAEGGLLAEGLETINAIATCTKPVIAAVNGTAVGGGCELALACHLRLASDTARFGQPEINLGIIPGWGGTHRLPRIVGEARALDWMLTGRMVSAAEALEAGLVCKVLPENELMGAARDLAAALAKQPRVAVRAILRAVRERALHPDRGSALEAEGFAETAASKDAAEGIAAFLEKRAPNFVGE
ncbi:MAG: enoyl-CoA hydratase/isomerase family protein [Candidatus Hydrogenedentes bacterium]|nr:enoyl-CoA hydratase/isomerase family protein [Candidatus Hydrogenedentota bacterium]